MQISILVVDDEKDIVRALKDYLELKYKFNVLYAYNGKQAMDILQQNPDIQLVLTDIFMPEVNGLDLLEYIGIQFPDIKCIVFTARSDIETVIKSLDLGATGFLVKPFNFKELNIQIERIIDLIKEKIQAAGFLSNMITNHKIVIKNDIEQISSIVNYLGAEINVRSIAPYNKINLIKSAIFEGFTNALEHGNLELTSLLKLEDSAKYSALKSERLKTKPFENRKIYTDISFKENLFQIKIRDEGNGFDQSIIPKEIKLEDILKPFGRGILMMKLTMDNVEYNEIGNEVTLEYQYKKQI